MKEKTKKKKTRTGRDWFYNIVIFILICIIAVCGWKIGKIMYNYYQGTKAYDNVAKIAEVDKFGHVKWDQLKKENPDIRAWLYSEGTPINYPVVQGKDNDYYLYRMFNKEYNGKGSLFVDANCKEPFKQFNTVVYGHRMKDGSMFKDLVKYRDDKDYYKKHKTMDLLTPEKNWKLEIISSTVIPADSDMYNMTFNSDQEKEAYIQNIYALNEIPDMPKDQVKVTPNDWIVMMSTCTKELDDARVVVWAKMVEK